MCTQTQDQAHCILVVTKQFSHCDESWEKKSLWLLGYNLSSSAYILMNHHFIVSLTAPLQSWAKSDPMSAWFANPVQAAEVTRLKQKQVNTRWRMWERNSNPGFASWESEQPQWVCAAGTRSPQPAVLVWMTRDRREESMQTTQQWEFKGEKEERNKRIDLRSSSRPFSLSGDVNEL